MMAGALILLAGSLVPALVGGGDAPAGVTNASLIIGYVLLAYGFFLAMRARNRSRETQEEERAEVVEEES